MEQKELEEARKLQMSLLPASMPELAHLDIAVYMKTATEVGGDYYDVHVAEDGCVTLAVGDAPGHRLRAGTLVTAAKSLFRAYADDPDLTRSSASRTAISPSHLQACRQPPSIVLRPARSRR